MKEIASMRHQLTSYKKTTKQLQDKIKDHEMLEEFYLGQLKERDEIER